MTIQSFPPAASAQRLVFADLRRLLHPTHRSAVS
jgi:acetyl esterase